ncbi:hypothetical protein NDU88_000086 [Pleurodeles waltl]|uniref:Uncharacterized protein n=1 Tax=Pleurodeles waltl TaxID=8319 RepID=A0AAV7L713_PLEWA|nr:hypothetical protein NDU88_000086 [Pleurodeles waltl]
MTKSFTDDGQRYESSSASLEIHHDVKILQGIGSNHLVINSIVFTKGKPFRLPLYQNYLFLVVLVLQVSMTIFFTFDDIPGLYRALEDVLLDNRKLWLWLKTLFKVKPGSNYKKMQLILDADHKWPQVKRVEYAADPISEDIGCTKDVY